ncbi:MAG: energy transducer TonB, partial [Rubrivirga sp.]
MAIHKAPHADLRRAYPIHRQAGLVIALVVTIAAFTVPLPEATEAVIAVGDQEVIQLEEVNQTLQTLPPPPPPPAALPPPVEVPDYVEVEEAVIEEVELDLDRAVSVPSPPA